MYFKCVWFLHINTVCVSVCVCGESCHSAYWCFPQNSEKAKTQGDSGVAHCHSLLSAGPSTGHSGTERLVQ